MKTHRQRVEHIKKAAKAANDSPSKRLHTVKDWRGTSLQLPVFRIDAEYLMFRLENGRTRRQQLRYLRDNPELPTDFFDDPESKKAQDAQRSILLDLVAQDFSTDLKTRGQEDPAIILQDGFILNGNRRVAALSDIGERFIDCVVLPEDTTPRDIYALEQTLQVARDFRDDYHWVNELVIIREGARDERYHFEESDQARILRLDDKDVKAKLRMAELVDAYLVWRQSPGEYDCDKLDDAEQIFSDLEIALRKDSASPEMQIEKRNAVFALIENKPAKGRLYGHVKDLLRNFDSIYTKLKPAPSVPDPSKKEKDNSKLGIPPGLFDKKDRPTPIFAKAKNSAAVVAKVMEGIADIKAANKQIKNDEALYEGVSDALRSLQGLAVQENSTRLDEAREKLTEIIAAANEIAKTIDAKKRKKK